MVLVDSRGISRVPRYSGTDPASQQAFHLRGYHPLWPTVPGRSTMLLVDDSPALRPGRPYNPGVQAHRFGLFRVRSPLLAESLTCFLFLRVLRWFTSPRSLPRTYGFGPGYPRMTGGGLPHSEISGSKPVCGSPELFAAYHVLHRLLAPRHSPYALSSLTIEPDARSCHPSAIGRLARPVTARARPPTALRADSSQTSVIDTLRVWSEELPFAGYSVVKEPAAKPAVSHRLSARTPKNRVHLRCGGLFAWLANHPPSRNARCDGRPSPLPWARQPSLARGSRERRLVENTGLEPVTSWLQTRRSPS